MTTFNVTLRFQYPAHDERDGITYEIEASTKAQAIARARRQAHDDGHVGYGGKGRVSFKAVEDLEAQAAAQEADERDAFAALDNLSR